MNIQKYIIVVDGADSPFKKFQLLNEEEYEDFIMENEESKLKVGIGAEVIKELLEDSTLGLDYPYMQIFGNDSKDICLRYDQIEQIWVEASTTTNVSK